MADITNRASKPNRSAGRLIQRLHQRAEQQFRPHWPKLLDSTKRATATHQKSHTKQQTLPAFLNRCIDVLLTHSHINTFEPQPDLTGEEYAEGYTLYLSNPASAKSSDRQHIFGDRRHAIYNQHMNLMRNKHTDSESQGAVKKCDPKQYQEIAQLARTLGEKNPMLPATFIATICNNLQGFYTYPDSPQQPCRMCQAKNGTSSLHFLQCPMLEQTRRPFIQEIAEHLAKIAPKSRLTTTQLMTLLFPIEEASSRQNPFPRTQLDDEDNPELPDYNEISQEEEDNDNDNPDSNDDPLPTHTNSPTYTQQQRATEQDQITHKPIYAPTTPTQPTAPKRHF